MMLAMLSGMRVTPFLLVPRSTPRGSTGRAKPLENLDPSTRGTVAQLLREVLVLVEEATAAAVPTDDQTARAS